MIRFGIDILLKQQPSWKLTNIGLVTNNAATTFNGVLSRKALLDAGFNIKRLFSPEHGLDVNGADGDAIKDTFDTVTGLPVTSLYGENLAPSQSDLMNIDILLFDIPDVGSRFYTYLWTMTYVMEAAAQYSKILIILDRPNPISGNLQLTEGPMLDMTTTSFLGRWPLPIRHSCTLGELAIYFNTTRNIKVSLEIVPCSGWNRNMFQPDWLLPFVPTSPAMQSFESMLLYPGICLLEATNVNEGRGTSLPFCILGAPWIDGTALATAFNRLGHTGVKATNTSYVPREGKYKHETCHGIKLEISAPQEIRSVINGLLIIKLIRTMYPDHFSWRPYPTNVNPSGAFHLDRLLGISNSESLFDLPFLVFIDKIKQMTQIHDWKQQISNYLIY
ncbi:unnamed protein product [Rotaria magnacalcarata]|uniref:DUF1343 domain-containing protein n=1 Tax=Rotaria magnacalcarata TaxID=392030 RepID=A0A816WVD3_9BILA|nr:unnamed protein product [Rotaria magnacalcarata]CAF4137879.1 unnamed protein product [Rotaria magnacalcarata]